MSDRQNGLTYAQAGVDIDAGNALIEKIKPLAKATRRPGADAALGGFGALFDLKAAGYSDPLLVSTTDGVGTKLKVAIDTGLHDTVGIDLVAMCVNDLLAQGAEPLLFLDYFATGKLNVEEATRVVAGIAEGCKRAGCALVGGETAEMPGMYGEGDYDLAGFSVGAVERGAVLPRLDDQAPGDVIIGLGSSRAPLQRLFACSPCCRAVRTGLVFQGALRPGPDPGRGADGPDPDLHQVGPAPDQGRPHQGMRPHYRRWPDRESPRAIAKGLDAQFDWSAWPLPPVFAWLQSEGGISDHELRRTFNCGVGLILIVAPAGRTGGADRTPDGG